MVASLFAQILPALTAAGEGSWLDPIVSWIINLMNLIGAPGVAIGIAVENLFPPIPSEVLLPLAGFTAAMPEAKFSPLSAIIWATVGSLVGALTLYWIGATLGHDRMVALANKLPLLDGAEIDKTVAWFQKHGYKAVFFGRMLPIFRSLISIPAGIERMNLFKFSILTAAGSLIWNSIFILAGYFLGDKWETVSDFIDYFKYLIIAIVALLFTLWLWRKFKNYRAKGSGA